MIHIIIKYILMAIVMMGGITIVTEIKMAPIFIFTIGGTCAIIIDGIIEALK